MASLTMISSRPVSAPHNACRGSPYCTRPFTTLRPRRVLARAEKKEMSDDDAKELGKQAVNKGGNAYIDELPPIPRSEVSPAMKQRMKDEYLGLGGAPNRPLQNNWFLYIIVGVTFLVFLSYITGSV